jgi:hypothetical protein
MAVLRRLRGNVDVASRIAPYLTRGLAITSSPVYPQRRRASWASATFR